MPHDELDDLLLGSIGRAAAAFVVDLGDLYLAPGDTLSHYWIIEAIGEGGTGVVYKATDLRLDRLVALKLLLASGSDVVREASRDGVASGTRAYMSPEQARGEELDRRSDIYSLGVMLPLPLPFPLPCASAGVA